MNELLFNCFEDAGVCACVCVCVLSPITWCVLQRWVGWRLRAGPVVPGGLGSDCSSATHCPSNSGGHSNFLCLTFLVCRSQMLHKATVSMK